MPRWNLAWLLGIAAVSLFGLTVSYSAPKPDRDKNYEMVKLLVDVLEEVDHKYVTKLDDDRKRKLIEDMINGGLDRLDPHSTYINAKEFRQFTQQSRGKFGGIGIQIGQDRATGQLTVISPMVGTPAYEAGIQAGDLIVKVEGKATESLRLSEVVQLIQGEPGTKVTLDVLHEGEKEPVAIPITRAEIEVQSVLGDLRKADNPKEWDWFVDKENKIAYIRVTGFSETTHTEVKKELEHLKQEGMRGLVLDLRNNPGGLLRGAVDIADMFLAEGRIVSTKGRNHKEDVHDAKTGLVVPAEVPMAVLVNNASASASEIVAAALQDHKRAIVVGERSYGKGSVQNIIELEDASSALKLTTASYWRPNGKNIHRFPDSKEADEWGVKPDEGFEIKMKDEDRVGYFLYRRDRDIVHGKSGQATPPKSKSEGKEKDKDKEKKPFEDQVLNKALEYLRGQIKKVGAALPLSVTGDA